MKHLKTSFKLVVPEEFNTLTTRDQGAIARAKVKQLLQEHKAIEVDFAESSLSPSFADELVGMLVQEIGIDCFKKTIKLSGANSATQALIKHVINQRMQKQEQTLEQHNPIIAGYHPAMGC